ncbi:hypothetical protein N8760_00785 [Rhodobacteraceae bacterium]|nr:hypothetical protein [Paracoccaceae bacterium]
MRYMIITLSLFFLPTLMVAKECPADFKRPNYKTRAAFCETGQLVADYYDFDKKIKCEDMEIDHLIPLKIAHCHGLNGEKLKIFANDPRNLKFTTRLRNRQKGAKNLHEFSTELPIEMRARVLQDGLEIMADYNIPVNPQTIKSLLATIKLQEGKLKAKARMRRTVIAAIPFVGAVLAMYFEEQDFQEWLQENPDGSRSDYLCEVANYSGEILDDFVADVLNAAQIMPDYLRPDQDRIKSWLELPKCDSIETI